MVLLSKFGFHDLENMMKKFTFTVDMVANELDIEDVKLGLALYCKDNHIDAVSQVKAAGIKSFSEQGFKVWRARVTGVTASNQRRLTKNIKIARFLALIPYTDMHK